MSLSVEVVKEPGYLRFKISGETTLTSMRSLADTLKASCEAHCMTKMLLDCAGMNGAVPLGDLFLVGQYFAECFHDEYRIAVINTPAHWQDNTFSETVVRSHGGYLNHFMNEALAKDWLLARSTRHHPDS